MQINNRKLPFDHMLKHAGITAHGFSHWGDGQTLDVMETEWIHELKDFANEFRNAVASRTPAADRAGGNPVPDVEPDEPKDERDTHAEYLAKESVRLFKFGDDVMKVDMGLRFGGADKHWRVYAERE